MTQTPTAPVPTGRQSELLQSERPEAGALRPDPLHPLDRATGLGADARPGAGRPSHPRRETVLAYVALTKPRIIELLLVTTLPAMILAAGGLPHWSAVVATLIGGTLAAGSANALNCYVDRDIDALMRRTGHRPLARSAVSPRGALVFGLALGAVAVAIMAAATNLFAAGLTLLAIAFYVIVYTMVLKRRTAQNIVWGGAAGCMPVLIGWVAVTNSLAWAPVVLFLVVFFWTPPHFWALAIRYREDYDRAGVPMLPVVATPVAVARQIVAYTWLTVATTLTLWPLATGWVYGAVALVAGAVLIAESHRLLHATRADTAPTGAISTGALDRALARPMRLFHFSNTYLAIVFVAVAADTFVR